MSKTVEAIVREGEKWLSATVRQAGDAVDVLRYDSWPTRDSSGPQAASAARQAESASVAGETVYGFASGGLAFHRIEVPQVKDSEMASLVSLQAESLLPLPMEEMELAWRSWPQTNGKVEVTIAAARREELQAFLVDTKPETGSRILLAADGIVKAWTTLFGGSDARTVIVHLGQDHSNVCLADKGRLQQALCLETRRHELSVAGQLAIDKAEQLAQDIRFALEMFEIEGEEVGIVLLSDGSSVFEIVAGYLAEVGLQARTVTPASEKPGGKATTESEKLLEHIIPLGVGALALDGHAKPLRLFERLRIPDDESSAKKPMLSLKARGMIAAALLVALLAVSYVLDVIELGRLESLWDEAKNNGLVVEQQTGVTIRSAVAARRADLLLLLQTVNENCPDGLMLNGFTYRLGDKVKTTGHAKTAEQMYTFQESLEKQKTISDVKLVNPVFDEKKKQFTFGVAFDYGTFTRKAKRKTR